MEELGPDVANSVRPPYRSGLPVDKIQPDLEGLIHMPPFPSPKVLHNPRCVDLRMDDLGQMCVPGYRLHLYGPPVCNLLMKILKHPVPVHPHPPPLG